MKTSRSFARPLSALALSFAFLGAGCTLGAPKQLPPTGGMWYSPDRGTSWQQTSVLYTSSGVGDWSPADVVATEVDPTDANALYVGTRENGMFYTYDSGKTWMQPTGMMTGAVQAVAVHPKDKCTIFGAKMNELWKSEDCNRSYKRVFAPELMAGDYLKTIAIDWYNPTIMYAVSVNGTLFKSTSGGANWQTAYRFDQRVSAFVIDPVDSRTIFAGLDGNGVMKTIDGGTTWVSLRELAKDVEGSANVKAMVAAKSKPGTYIVATGVGLMRTTDGGATWAAIPLLTSQPAQPVVISSIAVDPTNAGVIYYGTDKVFYRSMNGGANWETIKLPTARAAGTIIVHPDHPEAIYLGAKNIVR